MLELYNTMSHKKEIFKPRENGKVRIFTCGPSIYQKAHIGNYRTFLYEDLLVRYLLFKGFDVERAMNLTDIEDKAITEARRRQTNVKKLTDDVLEIFREGLDGFGFVMPEHLVPATSSIEQSVKIIKRLVEKGCAYEYDGDYFFDPLKVKDFGKLFGLDMSKWPRKKRRFKKDTYNGNRWNRGDFILWHSHKHDPYHPFWETEIGTGRPSWNIQDPSVVTMSIGDYVDINCGGIDNIYRHHDYNIAVMEAYTGVKYASYYMHGEHLIVDGKTMSKSKGNIIYAEDLAASGISWKDLRFFLTYTHYRKKLNYTEAAFGRTASILHDFRAGLKGIKTGGAEASTEADEIISGLLPAFEQKLDDDLSLGAGFDAVSSAVKELEILSRKSALTDNQAKNLNNSLRKIDNVLNVIYPLG